MDRGEKKKKQRGWMEGKKESDEEKIKEKKWTKKRRMNSRFLYIFFKWIKKVEG